MAHEKLIEYLEQLDKAGLTEHTTLDDFGIVRCKNCKHWFYFFESEKHHCTESDKHPWDCPIREADDFCSRGEKR